MVIYRYELEPNQGIDMPVGAKILCVQVKDGRPNLWALVDEAETRTVRRNFVVHTTGELFAPGNEVYLGTFQIKDGITMVFHIFELPA